MYGFIGKKWKCKRIGAAWIALGVTLCGQSLIGCGTSPAGPATDPNAQIAIQSPTGGERFFIGDSLRVKWKAQGKGLDEVNAVNIELSPDSGKTWVGMVTRSIGVEDPHWGNFAWAIPAEVKHLGVTYTLMDDSKLLLRIMQYATTDPDKIAVTQKTFSITAK